MIDKLTKALLKKKSDSLILKKDLPKVNDLFDDGALKKSLRE